MEPNALGRDVEQLVLIREAIRIEMIMTHTGRSTMETFVCKPLENHCI